MHVSLAPADSRPLMHFGCISRARRGRRIGLPPGA
jgi:hypothetical protein